MLLWNSSTTASFPVLALKHQTCSQPYFKSGARASTICFDSTAMYRRYCYELVTACLCYLYFNEVKSIRGINLPRKQVSRARQSWCDYRIAQETKTTGTVFVF